MHLAERIKICRSKGFILQCSAVQQLQTAVILTDKNIFAVAIVKAKNILDILRRILRHGSQSKLCSRLGIEKKTGRQAGQQISVIHY